MKVAAIDVGSNAIRIQINSIYLNNKELINKTNSFLRIPVRLGEEAFKNGVLSPGKKDQLISAFTVFQHLLKIHKVERVKIYATSAMREIKNSSEIIAEIKSKTGLDIQLIDGKEESEIVFKNYLSFLADREEIFFSIDVGGGSTDIVIYEKGEIIDVASWKIGTLRLLNNSITSDKWNALKDWLAKYKEKEVPVYCIGAGGNIAKMKKLFINDQIPYISTMIMKGIRNHLESMTLEERTNNLKLNPDRADVIVPAAEIFTNIMEWGGIDRVYVPKLGLIDGIMKEFQIELFPDFKA